MKNYRTTTAKTTIIELIESSEIALSQQDIQDKIGNLCNRVTTYRVLERLLDEGKVHKVLDFDGVAKYSSCENCEHEHHHDHHHVHFSCTVCNKVTCLHNVIPTFKLPENYTAQDYNFTVSGVCPECN
ncbi:MAG: transcriptional repressor [Chitinophagales bacterium]